MPEIVLTTLNAKYIHAAFGLRYLLANLGSLQSRAGIVEFDIHQRPLDIAEMVLARNPKIIGFGVYIWNVRPTTEVIAAIKRIRPEVIIIVGGPEVSYEIEDQPVVQLADHVIGGEADLAFAEVCAVLLEGGSHLRSDEVAPAAQAQGSSPHQPPHRSPWPLPKVILAELPDFSRLTLPYDFYTDEDVAHRIIYVEASRGCPFTCEFCLSSLDIPVRRVPLPLLLGQLQRLLDRGVKQFKFVDRTFNLDVAFSRAILEFFLARYQPGHFFHFELVPDRLPEALREIIAAFPPGALQFEIGIQTFNEEVGRLIRRRQNYQRLEDNLRFLRTQTGVHIHADLIAGLPGETPESFAAGFDRLVSLGPHEIQVGILKRLRGTRIGRHDAEWQMVYSLHPPYEILQNRLMDFATMQRMRRFARYWDLVGNRGNFVETTPLIWGGSAAIPDVGLTEVDHMRPQEEPADPGFAGGFAQARAGTPNSSPFEAFLRWSDWLHARVGRTDAIALVRLMELLFEYLVNEVQLPAVKVAESLWRDYRRGGRHDKPSFLKDLLPGEEPPRLFHRAKSTLPKRQARHLG